MMQNMVRYRRESSIYGEQGYLNNSQFAIRNDAPTSLTLR